MGAFVIAMLVAVNAAVAPTPGPDRAGLSVTVTAERDGEAAPVSGVVAVESRRTDGAVLHEEAKVTIPGTVTFRLVPGLVWTITLQSPEYWAAPRSLYLAAGESVSIPAVPAGTVRTQLDAGANELPEVSLWAWAATAGRGAPSPPLVAEEPCVRVGTRIDCRVPSGRLDLRLGARGFIPAYHWAKAVPPFGTLDIGKLTLIEGGSVSGWCDGLGAGQAATVVLTPVLLGGEAGRRGAEQAVRRSLSGRVSDRGFFQISGVPVGDYHLAVDVKGLVSQSISVRVAPGVEARLLEPIRLTPPASLAVSIVPPVDPQGQPWRLELAGLTYVPGRERAELQGTTSAGGDWDATGLSPGPYVLTVADGRGNTWDARRLDIMGPAAESFVMAAVEVEGRVTRKREPLAADVTFEMGPMAIKTTANAEGRFACSLPKEGRWEVRVKNESANATVASVEVRVPPGKSRTWVEIDLAATRLRGTVVDLAGQPQRGFTVLANSVGEAASSLAQSGSDGTFEINDLPVGEYAVMARSSRLQSRRTTVSLTEDAETTVQLVIEEGNRIRGIVTSAWGAVAGAGVAGFPVGAVQPGVTTGKLVVTTDQAGSFEITLPPGAQAADLLILPPGLAGVLVRLPASEEPVMIMARADGGLLRIVSPNRASLQVTNGTASLSIAAVSRLAGDRIAAGPGYSATLMMEPGRYGLCPRPQGQCAWGVLPPRGELTLESPLGQPQPSE
jgi:hypothetical protein